MSAIQYLLKSNLSIIFSESNFFMYVKNAKSASTAIKDELLTVKDAKMPSSKYKTVKEWLAILDDEDFDTYFKFTFVRNPWDRTVSLWNYFTKAVPGAASIPKCSFRKFLEEDCINANQSIINHSRLQCNTAQYNNEVFVDFIGKVENMSSDWDIVSKKIGVRSKLPIKNRAKHKKYVKYYDEWCIQKVAEIYKKDIELFGYEFGE